MKTSVDIAGQEMIVEYDFDITAHGNNGAAPSLSYPGDPPEPAEYTITVLGIDYPKRDAGAPSPEMPRWLEDVISSHLYERDDINDIVQKADAEYYCDPDYDR